jgi:hypothetical protein
MTTKRTLALIGWSNGPSILPILAGLLTTVHTPGALDAEKGPDSGNLHTRLPITKTTTDVNSVNSP